MSEKFSEAWGQFKADILEGTPEFEPVLDFSEEHGKALIRNARSHSLAVTIGAIFVGCVVPLFFFVYKHQLTSVQKAGASGDFIAGTLGIVLGIISVIALFITLKNDRLAKEEEGFEDKYYQLLQLHRANVAEIRIGTSSGRRVFVLIVREFRCILEQVKLVSVSEGFKLDRQALVCASYYALFYGVGPNSSRMLIEGLVNIGFERRIATAIDFHLDNPRLKAEIKTKRNFAYTPFEGHQSRLGHYFRHLYQMVTYVHAQRMREFAPWLSEEEEADRKRQYIKTIRAQLSIHEQALLLLNSLTPIGSVWWKDNIMVSYGLVKNLPKVFFEPTSEIDVQKHIPSKGYFEDEEIRANSVRHWCGWPVKMY